ncbi:MAG: ribonuclease P protein component [Candidatus Puniceispirillales bacterium]
MAGLDTIPKRRDFVLASTHGHYQAMPGLVVQMRNRGDNAAARLGITASKKIGNAVARNRAKRRLRAVADTVLTSQSRSGHDYVLIARYNTNHLEWYELVESLNKALIKLYARDTINDYSGTGAGNMTKNQMETDQQKANGV